MAAESSPKVPVNLNTIEKYFGEWLSDEQKQALRVLPNSDGGDKLISAQAASKFKKEIDRAKADADAAVDDSASASPLLDSIEKLKEFKSLFLTLKKGASNDVAKKREEAELAKQQELEKAKAAPIDGSESASDDAVLEGIQVELESDDQDDGGY